MRNCDAWFFPKQLSKLQAYTLLALASMAKPTLPMRRSFSCFAIHVMLPWSWAMWRLGSLRLWSQSHFLRWRRQSVACLWRRFWCLSTLTRWQVTLRPRLRTLSWRFLSKLSRMKRKTKRQSQSSRTWPLAVGGLSLTWWMRFAGLSTLRRGRSIPHALRRHWKERESDWYPR